MAASPALNFPAELVARSLEGPPVVVRFVDEPTDARPLSILVVQHNRDPLYVPSLPTYELDVVEAERETEMELPRFELSFLDPPALELAADVSREEPIPLMLRRPAESRRGQRPGWFGTMVAAAFAS